MVTIVGVAKSIVWEQLYRCVSSFVTTFHTVILPMTLSWQGTEDLPWIPMFLLNKIESNLQLCELDQPQNRAIWPSGKKQVVLLPWLLQTIEMWYLYFMNRSVVNLDMIIICSSTLVSILDNYTCQKCQAWLLADRKLQSHTYLPLWSNFSCLVEKFEPLQH